MSNTIAYLERLSELFTQHFNEPVEQVEAIPPSGSDRMYVRLIGKKNRAIGAYSKNKRENNTYFYFTKIFLKHGLAVPEIYHQTSDSICYLMEDKGAQSLLEMLLKDGKTDAVKAFYEKAVADLVKFQWVAGREIDYSMCYNTSSFDQKAILADLNYFKYYFADVLKINYDKATLQSELEQWSKDLDAESVKTFMYRDFQSRNVMINDGVLGYIDFQGGMKGLPHYDLVSLLWQAKAQLPKEWKTHLEKHYIRTIQQAKEIADFDEMHFMKVYLECVLLRILQTLGAYGLRGLIERKPHFISSIYPALQQLQEYVNDYAYLIKYPELIKVLQQLVKPEVIAQFFLPVQNPDKPLQVQIYSFSYKKGMPKDTTGHGGGFVFDCRGILNPGRFEEYKTLTGRDYPVQEFLQTKTEMPLFLENIFGTVDITINDYLRREFDYLTISFGCTGGQHRSVFAAEQMKKHLKEIYNIDASILHLEQDEHQQERR
ncbi:hypothetical protein DBR32_07615 [Taibaiella sp. KBW10]|uniref:RapZ C-terminal domain-containing protein n=1 Tax=Taibaiella sp. KBW10 TaxID=2153357 RepID=UPI000F5A71DB|nr:RNase adapter RapZ [Taibaiella sp. KBW10]RQO31800.1 hypothetical protein DBR32_07615 [Taibaiella sp. KBW10]